MRSRRVARGLRWASATSEVITTTSKQTSGGQRLLDKEIRSRLHISLVSFMTLRSDPMDLRT
jgi:hypothetical protein